MQKMLKRMIGIVFITLLFSMSIMPSLTVRGYAEDTIYNPGTLIHESGAVKVYRDMLSVEDGVIRDGRSAGGWLMRFPSIYKNGLRISLTTENFMGETREIFTVNDHIAYCFDVQTSASEGVFQASASLAEAGITHISQEDAEKIALAAYALTENNFAYFKEIADEIAKGFSNSYETVKKEDVVNFLKSDDENAMTFKRHLVQWMVWRETNPEVSWTTDINTWTYDLDGSGSAGGKEGTGSVSDVAPGYTLDAIIDMPKLRQKAQNRSQGLYADAKVSREYEYEIKPNETITLTGQEGEDIWAIYQNTGYFGDNGSDITVTRTGDQTKIIASDKPKNEDYNWQYSSARLTNAIYSSKPYARGNSGQFIVDIEAIEIVRAKIKVKSYGWLALKKVSNNEEITIGNSCYDLTGARYGVYTDSGCTVLAKNFETGADAVFIIKDSEGNADPIPLIAGDYYIKEILDYVPKGYLPDINIYQEKVEANVDVKNATWVGLENEKVVEENPLTYGKGIRILKVAEEDISHVIGAAEDSDEMEISDETETPGKTEVGEEEDNQAADNESAVFKVEFFTNEDWNGTPEKTYYFNTINGTIDISDEVYFAEGYDNSTLYMIGGRTVYPLGTIKITEEIPPQGYVKSDLVLKGRVRLKPGTLNETEINWETEENPGKLIYDEEIPKILNASIRADISFFKVDIDGRKQGNIPFLISRLDEGGDVIESHVIVSDENGKVNTCDRPKTGDSVNSLDQYAVAGVFTDEDKLDSEAGIWFGEQSMKKEGRGSLIFANYLIEELRCKANEGQDLLKQYMINGDALEDVFTDGKIFELDNIFVNLIIHPETEFIDDASNSKTLTLSRDARVTDSLRWDHLKVGKEYKLKTEVYYERTKDDVSLIGENTVFFVPEKVDQTDTSYGIEENTVVIDAFKLNGGKLHAVDYIYTEVNGADVLIASHNMEMDIESQSIIVPHYVNVITEAKDKKTDSHEGTISEEECVIDRVTIEGTIPGESYTVKGLYVYAENFVDSSGNSHEAGDVILEHEAVTITATGEKTVLELEFTIDSREFSGVSAVVTEYVYYKGELIGKHDDLNSEEQRIIYPEEKPEVPETSTPDPTPEKSEPPVDVPKTGDPNEVGTYMATSILTVMLSIIIALRNARRREMN